MAAWRLPIAISSLTVSKKIEEQQLCLIQLAFVFGPEQKEFFKKLHVCICSI